MKITAHKAVEILITLVYALSAFTGEAQNTLELTGGPQYYSAQEPRLKGPTSIPQTLRFFKNHSGSADDSSRFAVPGNELLVTFLLEDQSYLAVPQHNTGLTFGALPGWSRTNIKSTQVVSNNYVLNDSCRKYFTSHRAVVAHGIDFKSNSAIEVFLSTKPLLKINAPRSDSSRYYFGKLRIVFSRDVTDPVISIFGLGATTNFGETHLGFGTELELQSPDIQISKLSGTDEMIVDTTHNKILHSRSRISGTCGTGAACGSVLVKGSGIRELVFKVFLRADGGEGSWGEDGVTNAGDSWHMSISLADQ